MKTDSQPTVTMSVHLRNRAYMHSRQRRKRDLSNHTHSSLRHYYDLWVENDQEFVIIHYLEHKLELKDRTRH